MHLDKHLFALYTVAEINDASIKDEALWVRIVKVLRLRAGSKVILFNNTHTLTLTLSARTFTSKNIIHGDINQRTSIIPLAPTINLLQGIPKKSVFEEIIYNAAQLGVASIVPVCSKKAHDLGFSQKEQERFRSIMINACEQAKQFVVPTIRPPVSFEQAISLLMSFETQPSVAPQDERESLSHLNTLGLINTSAIIPRKTLSLTAHPEETHRVVSKNMSGKHIKILFDSNGIPYRELLPQCKKTSQLTVLFGPEGGLTEQEIIIAQAAGFTSTQLTTNILRSEDAPLVGIGLLRTLIA